MQSQTDERAFEEAIEKELTGTSIEELKSGVVSEPIESYGGNKRFYLGDYRDFDKEFAIDTKRFWHFLETTQAQELKKFEREPNYRRIIVERLHRVVKKYGLLYLLKKGLAVNNAKFTLFYPQPNGSSAKSVRDNFRKNEFSVTRQVHFSQANPLLEIDMVLFVNGLPLMTMELKNRNQSARVDGQRQYKKERDPKETLLNFGRCLVHFTFDTDEVYMTTRLNREKTFFLPFNKGDGEGKGNPVNPNGHKTAYMWKEIFQKESLAELIEHFVRFDGKEGEKLSKQTLFFPRYHQLDVVREAIKDVWENGVGKTYLIQHSAGSGKSNSLTWLAYRLIESYPKNIEVANGRDVNQPLFDSVIVVTDRRLLDKQIRDNIQSFNEQANIVAHVSSAKKLKESLEEGKRIIITTIQKFPHIAKDMADMSNRQFAIIMDEAHSSQDGLAHASMNLAMGKMETDEKEEIYTQILEFMKKRKMKNNASYFAFTATPKRSTLEKFGTKNEDGKFEPFHLYSMKQAIEEGFILDVLANYTTYKSYYEIAKSVADNPTFKTAKAQKMLKAFVEKNPKTIDTKSGVMLEHFISNVYQQKKLKGKAKGMVVTQDIVSAITYYQALNRKLKERGEPFKILIAFSDKKEIDGIEYSESDLNGFPSKDISEKFDSDEYRLLVVANKFLTGFDQPKLTAMYVDKKLQDVLAVQALSRLNRSSPKLGKKTEDLFVLDFFNKSEEIQKSFEPYYTATSLSSATDVNVLHDLKSEMGAVGVYFWSEVEKFTELYFTRAEYTTLSPIIDNVAYRFNQELELEDEQKADFKIKAKQFVKIYGQLSSILPFESVEWESLFWFLKFLIPKLQVKNRELDELDALLDSVDLSTYGLERVKLSLSIELNEQESQLDPQNPNTRGVRGEEDNYDELEMIIKSFNERWFHGWDATPEEQKTKLITLATNISQHNDYESKYLNNPDTHTKELAYKKIFDEVMLKERRRELELYKKTAKDEEFKQGMLDALKRILDILE
jgi:type I restriction enzyme R subunit